MIESGILTETKEESYITKALDSVFTKRSYDQLKANADGYETPAKITRAHSGESYIPDITATKNGRKSYFEVAIKNAKIKATVSKWRVLSTLAKMKNGDFYLLVPRGNYAFVQRLMNKYPIEAEVIKI